MKHFFKNIFIIQISILFLFLLFKDHTISKESIYSSFYLWLYNIVPSLFPMIIINDILINYNFPTFICGIFYKLFNKIFKLSYNGVYIFIMSMFIGTPTNAILTKKMLDDDMIDINEVNKLIHVCYFSNPLFLYNMLSLGFNKKTTIIVITTHYISNFIILFLIRNTYIPDKTILISSSNINFSKLIVNSINKAIDVMIRILGILCFYMLVTNYLKLNSLFSGLLEITTGLKSIINGYSNYKIIITVIIVNFGGLSIFTQIKSILEDTHINFINYFKGRLFQIIISVITIILLRCC